MSEEQQNNIPRHVAIERAANNGSDVILIGGAQSRELAVASVVTAMPNPQVASDADFGAALRRFAVTVAQTPVLHVHKQNDRLTITIMDMGKLEMPEQPSEIIINAHLAGTDHE